MIITRANPEQAAKLKALITGQPQPGAAPKRKAAPKGKQRREVELVPTYVSIGTDHVTVQLGLYLERGQYNAGGARWAKAATAKRHIDTTLLVLRSKLQLLSASDEQRAKIRGVTLVRLSPSTLDDDNLSSAFKHIRDAVFAWLTCGNAEVNMRAIGHYDATIKQGRHTCDYEQTKCDTNPKAHGVQIRLHV